MQHLLKKQFNLALRAALFGAAVILAACGGDGDSSSGGGGSPASFAGTYNGFATMTLNAPGLAPETVRGTIQIRIEANGRVTSDPGTDVSGSGSLNGNRFTVIIPGQRFNEPGLACSGTVVIVGAVSGNTASGSISGNGFNCNGVPIQISGSFEVVRAAPGSSQRQRRGDMVFEILIEALH